MAINCSLLEAYKEASQNYSNYVKSGNPALTALVTLMFLTTVTNVFFVVFAAIGLYRHLLARKPYLFFINRSISNAFTSLTQFIAFIWYPTNIIIKSLLITLMLLSFTCSSFNYCYLSTLKMIAVVKPFWYKKYITMRTCYCMVLTGWLLSFVIGGSVGTINALTFWGICPANVCILTIHTGCTADVAVSYLSILFCYLYTYWVLRRRRKENTAKRQAKTPFGPYWRLQLSIHILMFTFLPLVIVEIYGLVLLFNVDDVCLHKLDPQCYGEYFIYGLFFMLAGMTLDPLANAVSDAKFRQTVLDCLTCSFRKIQEPKTEESELIQRLHSSQNACRS